MGFKKRLINSPTMSIMLFFVIIISFAENNVNGASAVVLVSGFQAICVLYYLDSYSRKEMEVVINKKREDGEIQNNIDEFIAKLKKKRKTVSICYFIAFLPLYFLVLSAYNIPYDMLKLLFFTTLVFVAFKLECRSIKNKQKINEMLKIK